MKTLYLECKMGAAGDMLLGALLELMPNPEKTLAQLNGLGIPGVTYRMERTEKCGIQGTHMHVLVNGQEEHSHDHHAHEHMHTHEHDHDHAVEKHVHDHPHDHDHAHSHHHASIGDIRHILGHLDLSESVRKDAVAVYDSIAQAEIPNAMLRRIKNTQNVSKKLFSQSFKVVFGFFFII